MAAKQKRRTAQPDPDSKKPAKSTSDADLDTALADSFPASDPPSLIQPETAIGSPHDRTPKPEKANGRSGGIRTHDP
jgi:hypothetical protein